ncbi:hypothetical protein [Arthrobacter sp. AFG20]|uniref:hypothetical protein n=1 Tax=Arthrobacter sp. AFG20 TaxID=1688671 RepID=UPI000C9E0DA2|nr:hypothetical protein [Arthrobacter sp. AFG20]PNH85639.1 hypothetical protein CXZ05_04885 [Arthrobacter sp. AFG20]
MTIDIGLILSHEDEAHFAAQTEAVTAAMQQVRKLHPAYSWVGTDEIRCRGCNAGLDIPSLASTNANADKAFRAHQAAQVDAMLAADTHNPIRTYSASHDPMRGLNLTG